MQIKKKVKSVLLRKNVGDKRRYDGCIPYLLDVHRTKQLVYVCIQLRQTRCQHETMRWMRPAKATYFQVHVYKEVVRRKMHKSTWLLHIKQALAP